MTVIVVNADARALPLPDCSVDAVICDPPYGLEFMGQQWDAPWKSGDQPGYTERARMTDRPGREGSLTAYTGAAGRGVNSYQAGRQFQDWCYTWATEAVRVLKPGGHLLAFGGTRTVHRLTCALEDAGLEIRDQVADLTGWDAPYLLWAYGQGFPKSYNIAKAIDRRAGKAGIPAGPVAAPAQNGADGTDALGGSWQGDPQRTVPETAAAAEWAGWGTALKPMWEPIVVARKPPAGPVDVCVLRYGTGGLNVAATQVGMSEADIATQRAGRTAWAKSRRAGTVGEPGQGNSLAVSVSGDSRTGLEPVEVPDGRWPPNLVLAHSPACQPVGSAAAPDRPAPRPRPGVRDAGSGWNMASQGLIREHPAGGGDVFDCAPGCPVAELDLQSGQTSGKPRVNRRGATTGRSIGGDAAYGTAAPFVTISGFSDSGGASRFAPVFKYQPKAGSRERPVIWVRSCEHEKGEPVKVQGHWQCRRCKAPVGRVAHQTVKPVDLMRWLVRLVCPPGGTILEPFGGSGTTGEACAIEGASCVVIELDPEFARLAGARLSRPFQPVLFGPAVGDPGAW